jgi:hypothetical protein
LSIGTSSSVTTSAGGCAEERVHYSTRRLSPFPSNIQKARSCLPSKPTAASLNGHPLGPRATIGVKEDVLRTIVLQKRKHLIAQFALQFRFEPLMVFIMSNRWLAIISIWGVSGLKRPPKY